MKYKISTFFEQVPDTRIDKGKRYSMSQLLSIVIMAIISGEKGLRGIERFSKMSEPELVKGLKLKHGVPSYGTFHTLFENLNFEISSKQGDKILSSFRKSRNDFQKKYAQKSHFR